MLRDGRWKTCLPPDFPARIQALVRKLGLRKLKFYQMSHRWQQRPAWQGLWCMWFDFNMYFFYIWVSPLFFFLSFPPPLPLMFKKIQLDLPAWEGEVS